MPKPVPVLNVTIPVYNRFRLTQRTLLSLRRCVQTIPFVVTVVDNGSDKALGQRLLEFHKTGIIDHLFRLPRNMGIAVAANIGWRMVGAPYYMKLDNDIEILDPQLLSKLFRLWSYGKPLSTLSPLWEDRKHILEQDDAVKTPDGALGVDSTITNGAGAGILIPRPLSEILGLWNEDYGLYGAEDGDYGLRMKCAGFPQYLYLATNLTAHMGVKESFEDAGLSQAHKKVEHRKLFVDSEGDPGLFKINHYLFDMCIRAWKTPLRYEITDIGADCLVRLKERAAYREFRAALERCRILINTRRRKKGANAICDGDFIEDLKNIMRACGEGCDSALPKQG
ncbi:MAG: glycosyltransferase [Desulfovibrio sp.]|jgi:GT2 family glycosyltransferase|nr:glycosyltransferase [Desulfovibrio sp.]